jgi:hypothetical protein
MPRHIISAEDISVTGGESTPLTLTYSTADPEGANAGSFSFFVALDASALLGGEIEEIDTNPDLSGIQLPDGLITNTEFDIDGDDQPDDELLGFSASEDTDDIDDNPNTDVLINFAYADIPGGQGQPFTWPFQDTGETSVDLATIELQPAEDFTETSTVNFVLNEPSSQNPDPDNPDGPPINEAFDGQEGDILGTAEVAAQAATDFNLDVDGNGTVSPSTDGASIFRFTFGLRTAELMLPANDSDLDGAGVLANIQDAFDQGLLDVDENGTVSPSTDGASIFRYAFGLRTAELMLPANDSDLDGAAVLENIEALDIS